MNEKKKWYHGYQYFVSHIKGLAESLKFKNTMGTKSLIPSNIFNFNVDI